MILDEISLNVQIALIEQKPGEDNFSRLDLYITRWSRWTYAGVNALRAIDAAYLAQAAASKTKI